VKPGISPDTYFQVPANSYSRPVPTAADSWFRQHARDQVLLNLVRDVTQRVPLWRSRWLTMRRYDMHSGEGMPTAKALRAKLNEDLAQPLSWPEIVALAQRSPRDRLLELRARGRRPPSPRARRLLVFYGLRKVALALGAETLTADQYRRGRLRVMRKVPGSAKQPEWLPTVDDVLAAAGNWEGALRIAKLQPTPDRPPKKIRATDSGMAIPEAVARFCELNDFLPSRTTLEQFMADCGARLANQRPGVPWSEYLNDAAALMQARGQAAPRVKPRSGRQVEYRLPRGGSISGAPQARSYRSGTVTLPRCEAALKEFLRGRDPRQATRAKYLRWQVGTEWPAPSSFRQYGGFADVRRRVLTLNPWLPSQPPAEGSQ